MGCSTKHSPTWYVFRQHWLACLDFPPQLHKPGETELFYKRAEAGSVFTTRMICGGKKKRQMFPFVNITHVLVGSCLPRKKQVDRVNFRMQFSWLCHNMFKDANCQV